MAKHVGFALFMFLAIASTQLHAAQLQYKIKGVFIYNNLDSNVEQAINYNTGSDGVALACVGEKTNLLQDAQLLAIHSSKFVSSCDEPRPDSSIDCNSNEYDITSTNIVAGAVNLLPENDIEVMGQLSGMQNYNDYSKQQQQIIDSITTSSGGALLTLDFEREYSPPGEQVEYLKTDAGVGCSGEYKIYVDGVQRIASEIDKFNSGYVPYTFTEPGEYEVKYVSQLQKCAGAMKEKVVEGRTIIHPFNEKESGELPITAEKTVTFNAVSNDRVGLDNDGMVNANLVCEGLDCRLVEDEFLEGGESTVKLYLEITNKGDADVDLTNLGVESASADISIVGFSNDKMSQTCIPEIGCFYEPYTLKKGEKVTIGIDVTANVDEGASENNPHSINVYYDYEAVDENPCTNQKESGRNTIEFKVNAAKEIIGEGLAVEAKMWPESIDKNNYLNVQNNGVTVNGTVSILPDNIVPADGGAEVTLTAIDFVDENNARSSCLATAKKTYSDNNGYYEFKNVALDSGCIDVDKVGSLEAEIEASFKGLSGSGKTTSGVNTGIEDLKCRLNIDDVQYSGDSETYSLSAVLINEDLYRENIDDSYSYDCGDGNGLVDTKDKEFSCSYSAGSTPDATKSAYFEVGYKKGGKDRTATCSIDMGLCSIYIE